MQNTQSTWQIMQNAFRTWLGLKAPSDGISRLHPRDVEVIPARESSPETIDAAPPTFHHLIR